MSSILHTLSFRPLRGLLVFIAALALGACGGTTTSAPTGGSEGVGSVGIVLTDAPNDEFLNVFITVQEVLLLPADDDAPAVSIFSGEQTVDLLSLRDHAELFALNDVPAGRYEKIRLILKRPNGLELVTLDGISHFPRLPGNGKLDLNPRGGFNVANGGTTYLQIDIDAEKSIYAKQSGDGSYQFRPVVFVDIISGAFSGKLVRRTGYVEALATDGSRFALCDGVSILPVMMAATGGEHDDDDHDGNMACLNIVTANASVFGADGLPLADLVDGQRVSVVGFLRRTYISYEEDDDDERHDRGDGNRDDDEEEEDDDDHESDDSYAKYATLYAEVIEVLADVDGFETIKGAVASEPVDATDSFSLKLADGGELISQLQASTKVFARDGTRLSFTDILISTLASVDGVNSTDPIVGKAFLTSLVILDTKMAKMAERVMGTVSSSDPATRTLTVTTATGDVMVQLEADGLILLLGDFVDGARSESSDFAALTEGRKIEIYGRRGALGYFVAQVILITG